MDQEKAVKGLGAKAGRELYEGTTSQNSNREEQAAMNIFVILAIILFVVGAQAMKVIFRTNMGKNVSYLFLTNIAALAFIAWGMVVYFEAERLSNAGFMGFYAEELSFLFTSIFYLILGVLVFFIGYKEASDKKNNQLPDYQGDSILLDFLENSGWRQSQVQRFAEPLTLLAVALVFLVINPYLGLPLIFCFFSLVATILYEGVSPDRVRNNVAQNDNKEDFSAVTE